MEKCTQQSFCQTHWLVCTPRGMFVLTLVIVNLTGSWYGLHNDNIINIFKGFYCLSGCTLRTKSKNMFELINCSWSHLQESSSILISSLHSFYTRAWWIEKTALDCYMCKLNTLMTSAIRSTRHAIFAAVACVVHRWYIHPHVCMFAWKRKTTLPQMLSCFLLLYFSHLQSLQSLHSVFPSLSGCIKAVWDLLPTAAWL